MVNEKNESTEKVKPEGNTDPAVPNSPDVKEEGWSAEEIAEQAAHKDGSEVKQEIQQGQQTQEENGE
ncbi:MAG TPA: hypothetical protein VGB07_27760 [Blastocatellia bacterium]|jgi:hypothetical protein